MATSDEIADRIVDALYVSDPEIDTSIGTPLRKIIDTFADQAAQLSVDGYLNTYQYDIDSATAGTLDDFCADFGISRLAGARSAGTVTFSRSSDIANAMATTVPSGTQVTTGTIPQQTFQTTTSTIMDVGTTSVDVAVQSLVNGPDGNIAANTPLQLVSTVDGVSTVSNAAAFTGGSLDETDDQLRARWKATVFRNLAGTSSMYQGIALQTLADNAGGSFGQARANIIGSTLHNLEQLQVASGTASSSLTTAAYYVGGSVFVIDSNGNVLTPNNNYTLTINNSANPATLTVNAVSGMPDGFYNVEYDYVPIASRNDPFNTRWGQGVVNNRVDVYVNGVNAATAVQNIVAKSSVVFTNTTTSSLYYGKYVTPSGAHPVSGDLFVPLGFCPIIDLALPTDADGNDLLTLGTTTYTRGTDFEVVHDDDAFGYTPSSLCGLWFKTSSGSTVVADGSTAALTYTYNDIPLQVNNNLANWRLLGTDVQIHAGKPVSLRFNIAVVYDLAVNTDTVNTGITTALTNYLQSLGFQAAVQVSDVVQAVHNVPGVDNVRLTNSTDNAGQYGIQSMNSDGTVIKTYHDSSNSPKDVYFDERSYPTFYGVVITPKARNTFRP